MDILRCIKQFIHRKRIGNTCSFGNRTTIDSTARFEGENKLLSHSVFLNSSMGYASYVSDHSFIKNTVIGRYTCIANEVMTVAGNHPLSFASVHPAFYSTTQKLSYVKKNKFDDFHYLDSQKRISVVIGNDVWIGANVTVLPGVTIGSNTVIGAGSVVTKDIPSGVIALGNPCRVIRNITEKDKEKYPVWKE